jgi:hypothetical protein
MRMRMNWKQLVWIAAMAMCFGVTAGTARATASASPQEQHDQDYSKNKNYQVGVRDGRDDSAKNLDHSRKRKFKKDEDQKAYESGYQSSHPGTQPDHK